MLERWPPDPASPFLTWLCDPPRISWPAAIVGAGLGTYSHVVLDSVMHADMQPLFPFSETNGLLDAVSLGTLHLVCVAAGLLGGLALRAAFLHRRRAPTG